MAEGRKTMVIILAVVLALAIAGAAVVYFLPTTPTTPPPTAQSTPGPQRLDLSILQSTRYTQLDTSLLQQGALPVAPPAAAGKANPFL